jgi:hypothetical protein
MVTMAKPMQPHERRLWRIKELLWLRRQCLECMAFALRAYKQLHDQQFYEYAKQFGERARDLKSHCEVLQREDS